MSVRDVRTAGAVLLAGGLLLPLVPGHAGLPCPLRTLTGVPCPLCGMTTSVEDTMHLHLGAAAGANPAGPLAVLVALSLLVVRPAQLLVPRWMVAGGLLSMWLFELHRFGFL